MKKILLIGITLITLMPSCKLLRPSIMLKTPRDYAFSSPTDTVPLQYKIFPNDLLQFRLFSNDGSKLVDVTITKAEGTQMLTTTQKPLPYLVEFDGTVNLPLLGRVKLANMTLREAEIFLKEKYSKYYIKPFVMLSVINRRVIVFPGSGSSAIVIKLENENTTLIEAIAKAGGITNSGKANKIRLIRGNPDHPQVFDIDLSTIDGVKAGSMILQANDIIYVEPVLHVTREMIQEITPLVTLLTGIVTIIGFIRLLSP